MKKLIYWAATSLLTLCPLASTHALEMQVTKDQPTMVAKDEMVRSDEDISRAVKAAITADKDLSAVITNFGVKSDKGVVTLTGVVPSDKIKSDIGFKVQQVSGIKSIVNNLEVKADIK